MDEKSIEVAILTPATEAENMMDDVFAQAAPKGRFSKTVMNALVKVYRDAQKMMGFPEDEMYAEFTEDVTEFPPEFVRGLAMLASAAEDFGQPDVIILDGITKDEDVARLAAKIEALLADPKFSEFLSSPMQGEAMEETVEETVETPEGEEDMEAMFASRA